MSADKPQFEIGHQPPIGFQDTPGLQQKLPQEPVSENVPTEDGGLQLYKAAAKLSGKKAIITGGDSGIGRATAILFAMEGAESLIAYLPEEEADAQQTKKDVEKYGQNCHLLAVNLKQKENCRKVVDEALRVMGGIDILFNNHAYQNVVHGITELSEEQWEHTFDTNIHRKFQVYLSL
jgi:NAD(P)-dependent dehydrogenase (short-subunit alcohol dehydrogenase family)